MKRYTVLLLRPDHVADGYGEDTYLAHVRARSPRTAIKRAQREVKALDGHDDVHAGDYYPLITMTGHHNDLTPDDCR